MPASLLLLVVLLLLLSGPTAPLTVADARTLRDSKGLHPQLKLDVKFHPKENCKYRSRFRVAVRKGQGFDLVLSGGGSYEEEADPWQKRK